MKKLFVLIIPFCFIVLIGIAGYVYIPAKPYLIIIFTAFIILLFFKLFIYKEVIRYFDVLCTFNNESKPMKRLALESQISDGTISQSELEKLTLKIDVENEKVLEKSIIVKRANLFIYIVLVFLLALALLKIRG